MGLLKLEVATRGASRANASAPSTKKPTTIASGSSSRPVPPISAAAVGALGSMTAWRSCETAVASGDDSYDRHPT